MLKRVMGILCVVLMSVALVSLAACVPRGMNELPPNSPFAKWVGSEATAQKLLNLRLPHAPLGLAFIKDNPDAYANKLVVPTSLSQEVALFAFEFDKGIESLEALAPWLWMPNAKPEAFKSFTPITLAKLQKQVKALENSPETIAWEALESQNVSLYTIPQHQELLIYTPKWGAFLLPASKQATLLPYLNALLEVNQGTWRNDPQAWSLAEDLSPVLTDAFNEFPNVENTAHQINLLNIGETINQKMGGIGITVQPTWVVKIDAEVKALASNLSQQDSNVLIQLPRLKNPQAKQLDLAELEYLLKGNERPVLQADANVNYLSIQHVDRLFKKLVLENMPKEKQNQLKMLNPVLSLFHLNLERDVIGLFAKRSFFIVDQGGHRAFVLEPTPEKQKTMKALLTHLGQGGSLNSVLLKNSKGNAKYVIESLPWQSTHRLLRLNPTLGSVPFVNDLRFYESPNGFYISGQSFFNQNAPNNLNTLLRFDETQMQETPWLTYQVPNVMRSLEVLMSPVLTDKQKTLMSRIKSSGLTAMEGSLNFSNRSTYALSGSSRIMVDARKRKANAFRGESSSALSSLEWMHYAYTALNLALEQVPQATASSVATAQ